MNYLNDFVIDKYEKYMNLKYESNKNLKVEIIDNGYILPVNKYENPYNTLNGTGGVLDNKKEYVNMSAQLRF